MLPAWVVAVFASRAVPPQLCWLLRWRGLMALLVVVACSRVCVHTWRQAGLQVAMLGHSGLGLYVRNHSCLRECWGLSFAVEHH